MPRTAAKGGRRVDNRPPLVIYNSLDHHKQLICWHYFRFIQTGGLEGWNPAEAGSINHQRSSEYLIALGSSSWFRHIGKQMVTLAQKLAQLKETPQPPIGYQQQQDRTSATPSIPLLPNLVDFRQPVMQSPTGAPRTPLRAGSSSNSKATTSQAAPENLLHAENHGLSAPTSYGMWKKFSYTSRKTTTSMMIRVIVHNAVQSKDIQFEWVTPRRLKLRVAWPEWFQYAEQMAEFTIDAESGEPRFPPEHPLTMDTSERNQALVDEDGRIWDDGFLIFHEDMKTDDPVFELLEVTIESQATVVKVLQITGE
jgi:hypothetical protein